MKRLKKLKISSNKN